MLNSLFVVFALFFSLGRAFAGEIIFEGYYRVEASGKHIGYVIQRYEFDKKAKTFDIISFTRLKVGDEVIQESLKAKSNDQFDPISYNYTSQVNDKLKGIDATFKGEIMKLKINDGKNLKDETHKIPAKSILSNYLVFVMLQKELPIDKPFKYSGIAEEEGAGYWGRTGVIGKEKKGALTVLKITNSFKGEDFDSDLAVLPDPDATKKDRYIKAEVIATESRKQAITTRLVTTPSQATENQQLPNKTLVALFGNIPTGKVNLLAQAPTPEG